VAGNRSGLRTIIAVLAIILACALATEYLFSVVPPGLALPVGQLTQAQEKSIDVMLALCDSFFTWAIAVIGGVAVLLKLNIEEKIEFVRRDALFASAIIFLAVASIFCGHLGIDLTKRALALQQFPVSIRSVHLSFRFQYLAALGAIALFGAFAIHFFLQKAKQ